MSFIKLNFKKQHQRKYSRISHGFNTNKTTLNCLFSQNHLEFLFKNININSQQLMDLIKHFMSL